MIEKKLIVEAVRKAPPGGWKVAELASVMGLTGAEKHRLRRLLEEMSADNEVVRAAGARYHLPGAAEIEVVEAPAKARKTGKAKPGPGAPRVPTPPPRKTTVVKSEAVESTAQPVEERTEAAGGVV